MLALLPHVAFLLLALASWKQWVVPFADGGREMNTPARLASGELLYRDVGSYYGPWPPYLDAAALRLFGRHLDVLFCVRAVASLLGIEALRRLALRIGRHRALASASVTFAVAACAFDRGGFWLFPYSVAALEGAIAGWGALLVALAVPGAGGAIACGLCAGLAAGAKLEFVPVVLVVSAARAIRDGRRGALLAVGASGTVAAFAWAVPWILLGTPVLRQHGFLIALRNPEAWQLNQQKTLFAGQTLQGFVSGGFVDVLFPSLPFLGGAALLLAIARPGRAANALALALGLASAAVPSNSELHALLPLGLAATAVTAAVGIATSPCPERRRRHLELLAVVALAGLLAVRQPFWIPRGWYTSFTAPLALCVVLAALGSKVRRPATVAAFVFTLAGVQAAERLADWRPEKSEWFRTPSVSVRLPRDEARFCSDAAAAIERDTAPGDPVAVFPEPGFLLFATNRSNPFVDEQFHQGVQEENGEAGMIARLRVRPPAAVIVTDRALSEHGNGTWGDGILDEFFRELKPMLVSRGRLGASEWTTAPIHGDVTSATYFVAAGQRDSGLRAPPIAPSPPLPAR